MQPEEKSARNIQGRQILVVDDDPAISRLIKTMLEREGHKVQTVGNGKEALSLLEQGNFDMVFTDYSMPEMKGDKLAVAIKQRTPNLPVVMITSHADVLLASGNPLTGVDFLLNKPFLLEDLREALARVLPGITTSSPVELISAHSSSVGIDF